MQNRLPAKSWPMIQTVRRARGSRRAPAWQTAAVSQTIDFVAGV
jgi:hypothetical protein